jgi:iron complex transport system substrate-binding protein
VLNPDVIVLPTDWGYHPPKELYNSSYYQNLQDLDAVKNHRVWALPWTPYNCAKRLEYPIEIMVIAKAAYPDLFSDILIHEWVLDFYQQVYHVDQDTAKELRSIQWLDWTVEENV